MKIVFRFGVKFSNYQHLYFMYINGLKAGCGYYGYEYDGLCIDGESVWEKCYVQNLYINYMRYFLGGSFWFWVCAHNTHKQQQKWFTTKQIICWLRFWKIFHQITVKFGVLLCNGVGKYVNLL